MIQKNIKKAVEIINRSIKFYQSKLLVQLEVRAEAELSNGNMKTNGSNKYESNIEKYEVILSDLLTIRRAIINKQSSVIIYGMYGCRSEMYRETEEVLGLLRISFERDEEGKLTMWSKEE